MNESRVDAFLGNLAGFLALACVFMVGAGMAWPSDEGVPEAAYRPMNGPATPLRLVVPALRIKAPVQPIDTAGTALDPPRNPREVGWWQRSARPGLAGGQTVLTGHSVHTGGGAMDQLARLSRGDVVRVVTRRGTMVYRTTRVVTWTKTELAQRARQIFAQQRPANRLVLITCSGWTGSGYTSNVVVFATPLGVRA